MKNIRHLILFASSMSLLVAADLGAQPTDEDDEIIVTGSRIYVTQGGAQDIQFFKTSLEDGVLPAPGAITSEGLLSTYDLTLPAAEGCDQLFCLVAETMPADFIVKGESDYLTGLGFATNLTYESWERDPLTIVAVVDISGSMRGQPLDLAKASMLEVLSNLRDGDRMAVAQYGDAAEIVIPVTDVTSGRADIEAAIEDIFSSGATYMEAGLELAFKTADKARSGFDGNTRVVLFTDEQPNVGQTDSESFIGMARAASEKGIGLTTVGVADHFGADLANRLSAARGGNLFYVSSAEDIKETFGADFDLLVTAVAHDLELTIKPAKGVEINSVYGVPGEDIRHLPGGALRMVVPSVFLSSKGGGVFLGINENGKSQDKLGDIRLKYIEAKSENRFRDDLEIPFASNRPSQAMQQAHLLVDEYEVLKSASSDVFFGSDLTMAISRSEQLEQKLAASADAELAPEIEMMSNFKERLKDEADSRAQGGDLYQTSCDAWWCDTMTDIHGKWQVMSVRNRTYPDFAGSQIDIRRGDMIAFHLDNQRYDETHMFNLQRQKPRRGEAAHEIESVEIDTDKKRIRLFESEIDFDYALRKDTLRLYPDGTDLVLVLRKL